MAQIMKEAAAAVHLLPECVSERNSVRSTLVPDLLAMPLLARAVTDASIGITLTQAKAILSGTTHGTLTRTSPTQGGRAWLNGEWALDELEALCAILRHEAGDQALGAAESVVVWKGAE
ncbi:hypothetical protein QTI33_34735 [Variovorax sp. J22P271]|uniref:hypothetical protein n=1 Tax=Variovorax davisae TaxID=3053515 RepID=UPI002578A7E7|nr:hypothetical protein [Variovorax sp. J22P271]MDM0037326.1 hypothetical protein [Variovorax sp. J22P271]